RYAYPTLFRSTPHRAVAPQERRAGALFAAESEGAVEQAVDEPLEPDRHFAQLAPQLPGDTIDEAARDQRLADGGARAPARAIPEQILNGCCEVEVRIEQPMTWRDDAVAIRIRIVAEREVVAVLERDQVRH